MARVGLYCPGVSLNPRFCGWNPLELRVFLLGFGEGVLSKPVCDFGLFPTLSHGSLRSGAHPWIIIRHQGTSGCPHDTQVLREFSWLNSSPCCHHQAACKREVRLRRLSITPSFSSSKTCLLKPPLGSLIFAWLYISGDIWTEIARKRL